MANTRVISRARYIPDQWSDKDKLAIRCNGWTVGVADWRYPSDIGNTYPGYHTLTLHDGSIWTASPRLTQSQIDNGDFPVVLRVLPTLGVSNG